MNIRVTLNITEDNRERFDFDMTGTAQAVCEAVLAMEWCPVDTEISLTYVDDEEIHAMNREYRGIDRATDVLSFPNIDYGLEEENRSVSAERDIPSERAGCSPREGDVPYYYRNEEGVLIVPSSWNRVLEDPEQSADCMDPDTGNLFLGDIILNLNRVKEQAGEYGHSIRREFAFLIAHSMLHLCGYDHMTEEQSAVMFGKQEQVLKSLSITRETDA